MVHDADLELRRELLAYFKTLKKKTVQVKSLHPIAKRVFPHESDLGAINRLHDLLTCLEDDGVLSPIGKKLRPEKVKLLPTEAEKQKARDKEVLECLRAETIWVPKMTPVSVDRKSIHDETTMDRAITVNSWLKKAHREMPLIPQRERALEIFGDEKALDGVARKGLFSDRISLEDLRCFHCPEPLPHEAFSKDKEKTRGKPLLIVENSNTYWSCYKANEEVGRFAAIVYGKGNMISSIETGCNALRAIEEELCSKGVYYFGDLDPTGLAIPKRLSEIRQNAGLSEVLPERSLYAALIQKGPLTPCTTKDSKAHDPAFAISWLGADLAEAYLAEAPERRWPQEGLGVVDIEAVW